jgi:hypothetical protein
LPTLQRFARSNAYPVRSNNCLISVVIRPLGDANSFMMEKWSAPGISS